MKNSNDNAARTNEQEADALAIEMERACDAVANSGGSTGQLKQTAWYQDRKALLIALRR